ncbi:hypothetical protein HD596_010515 [Nonomuraea jabiensis]|uniref:ATP-binding protein n=1 Tax=Nonomuraea jabiensis TaxID=882448 RepID=A0A7W9GH81_9ACTN|nr:hypothetical protein [Nonomuraea jabiensis]
MIFRRKKPEPQSLAANGPASVVATNATDVSTSVHYGLAPGSVRAAGDVRGPERLVRLPFHLRTFVGRTTELTLLDQALVGPGSAVIYAAHGLDGIGKSALAAHWADRRRTDHGVIWWITADSPAALRTGLADLAVAPQPDEALELLRRVSDATDLTGAADLCADLDYLPLAIEQVGAYLLHTGLSPAESLRLLDTSDPIDSDVEHAVTRLWHITLDRLTPEAARLLRLLAWSRRNPPLAPHPAPAGTRSRLRPGHLRRLPPDLPRGRHHLGTPAGAVPRPHSRPPPQPPRDHPSPRPSGRPPARSDGTSRGRPSSLPPHESVHPPR